MSLGKSLLTTLAIFAVVWSLVYLNTYSYRQATAAVPQETSVAPEVILLTGIQESVRVDRGMDEVYSLWQRFYDQADLHLAMDAASSKRVYGFYRFDDAGFDRAQLFIGYNTAGRRVDGFDASSAITLGDYRQIHESSESWDTTPAWKTIDFGKSVHSVLEEYEMDAGGEVAVTRVYVLYQ